MSKLICTRHKGFQMQFENGVTVSVQWGPGNYCDNYDLLDYKLPEKKEFWESSNTEVAAWRGRNGRWITNELIPDLGDDVKGYLSADEVADFITKAKALK